MRERELSEERRGLAEQWIPLVSRVYEDMREAYHPATFCIDPRDARSAGYVGLCRAACDWDEARGVKFMTFAYRYIYNEIAKEAQVHGSTIRVPEYLFGDAERCSAKTREERKRDRDRAFSCVAADFSTIVDAHDHEAEADRLSELEELRERYREVSKGESRRSLRIVWLRLVENWRLKDVAAEFGITREHAAWIIRTTLRRLHERAVA